MSGHLTNIVKEKKCIHCREVFGSHKKGNGLWQDYCPRCVKAKVWISGYSRISDEGVVIK